MKNFTRLPLTILILSFLLAFVPKQNFAFRSEIVTDTIENGYQKKQKVPGRSKANTSVGIALVTIFTSYLFAAWFVLGSFHSSAVLLIAPVIGIISLWLGFTSLNENRRFLRSGKPIDPAQKAKQRRVRKTAIAGITIGFFGTLLALIALMGNSAN